MPALRPRVAGRPGLKGACFAGMQRHNAALLFCFQGGAGLAPGVHKETASELNSVRKPKMNRTFFTSFLAMPLMMAVFAQGPQGPGPSQSTGNRQNAGVNMSLQTTVEGIISSVQIAYGAQYPSIVVDKQQIKVAPVWYLLENGFELTAGETVRVVAAPSLNAGDAYIYAISITRTAGGAALTLRNEAGVPLWRNHTAPTRPPRARLCPVSIRRPSRRPTGIIDRVNAGLGIQFPVLVLKLQDNTLLSVKLGPERMLLAADFELNPGAALTVQYAAAT